MSSEVQWALAGIGATVVIGTVGVLAGWLFWVRPRSPSRRLAIDLATTSVVEPDIDGRIGVTFDGAPVSRVSTTHIELRNCGRATISDRHVRQAIGIRFPPGVQILGEPEVLSAEDGRIRPSVSIDGRDARLGFDFLDAGDWIRAGVTSSMPANATPQRIGTVEDLKRGIEDHLPIPLRTRLKPAITGFAGLAAGMASSVVAAWLSSRNG